MSEAEVLTRLHTRVEIDNYQASEENFKNWLEASWPSSIVVPEIHKSLLDGIESYRGKGIVERLPGEFRKEDIRLTNEPENFYVRGTDVSPVIREYFRELDQRIQDLPESPDGHIGDIVKTSAWAYYVFERIHPFLDGNGRTGRIILNRILMGAGFEKLIFLDTWFEQERENHLDAMNLSDKLGSLAPLEYYLLQSLRSQKGNLQRTEEIGELINQKEKEIIEATVSPDLSNIWSVFNNIDLATPEEVMTFSKREV